MDHLDELLEHLLGDGEVGDDAVLHRPDRGDVAGRAPEHLLGGEPDFLDHLLAVRSAFLPDRHHRGLVEHDALVAHEDERVGGAEIDREVVVKVAAQETEHKAFRRKEIGSFRQAVMIPYAASLFKVFSRAWP